MYVLPGPGAKPKAQELDLEYRPVQLRDLIGDVMAPLMRSAHGLDVGVVVEDDCPVVVVTDPGRLRQVIGHLVGNAIKFTALGSVRLRVSCHDRHPAQSYPGHEGSNDLVISRAVARAMGGDIEVESVPGVGSTFSFTVLAAPGSADVVPDAETRAAQPATVVRASPEPPLPGTATQEPALRILLGRGQRDQPECGPAHARQAGLHRSDRVQR